MAVVAAQVRPEQTYSSRRSFSARHLFLVAAATSAVTLLPVAGARAFEVMTGTESIALSMVVGIALSLVISQLGERMWSSVVNSEDIVFGELLVWGWLRRVHSDRRLSRASQLLGLDGNGWAPGSDLTPEEQALVLRDLANALERRDAYTHGHSNRVTRYSYAIAQGMGLDAMTIENIRVAASFHDVGKMDIPLDIINKPGALTDEEFDIIKQHSVIGAEMVTRIGNPAITEMVRHHHERLDGSGYPDRLVDDEIPLGARIIAVADTFDAICSNRPYRKPAKHKTALAILKKEAGIRLDHDAVAAFIKYYSGRGTFEWRAVVTTIPQRMIEWLGRSTPASAFQGAAIAATAVTIAASPLPLVPDAMRLQQDRSSRAISTSLTETESGIGTSNADDGEGSSSSTADGDGGSDGSDSGENGVAPGTDAVAVPIEDGVPAPEDGDAPPSAGSNGDQNGQPEAEPAEDGAPPGGGATQEPTKGTEDPPDETTDPGDDVTDPVTDPVDEVTDPVTDPIDDTTDPVTDPIDDVTDPVDDVLDPVGGLPGP